MECEADYRFSNGEAIVKGEDGEEKKYGICSICGNLTESIAGIEMNYDSGIANETDDMDYACHFKYCWCDKCRAEIGEKIHSNVIEVLETLRNAEKARRKHD